MKHWPTHAYANPCGPWALGSLLSREFPKSAGFFDRLEGMQQHRSVSKQENPSWRPGMEQSFQGFQLQRTNCHIWVNFSGSKNHRMHGKSEDEKLLHWDGSTDGWKDTLRTKVREYGGSKPAGSRMRPQFTPSRGGNSSYPVKVGRP